MHLKNRFVDPQTIPEQNYNVAHIQTRNTIERSFGVLKRRYPGLSLGLRLKMDTNLAVIVACCVLHNMAILLKDENPPVDEELQIPGDTFDAVPFAHIVYLQDNTAARTAIINAVFTYNN